MPQVASPGGRHRLQFSILGPLAVSRDGEPLKLGGERQRALLAVLLLHANEVVSSDRLVDLLFGAEARDSSVNALQAAVSRLRRLLDDGRDGDESALVTSPRGYLLRADADQLDLALFERLAADGRQSLGHDSREAEATLSRALDLWRGPPLADVASLDFAVTEIRRLEELRLSAQADLIDAQLGLGKGAELVPELEKLVAANPLQERLRGQLMLALYRAGRQADALEVYRQTRELLNDELGLDPSRALQELERAILQQDDSLDSGATEAPASVVVCPFKGLAFFDVADAEYFCGRERIVTDLVSRLAAGTFVGIVGPSGSGKSSLLRAGLLAALAGGALPQSEHWERVVIRPGSDPATALSEADGERVVLAVDQLEEIFTACEDAETRAAFLDALVDAANDPKRRAVVAVAMRADFYGRAAEHPRFAALLSGNHVLVGPMERDELVRAIELPAGRAGLEVERGLVDALVADVLDEPGGLPLLSTAMLELWRLRDTDVLRLDSYRRSGGVHGAVARLAEDAYGRLTEDQQTVARRVMLRLATGDETAVARRRVPTAELGADRPDVARVLAVLTDARLLTADEGSVEVAHEALLREWPRFRSWFEEERAGRRLHAHLGASAREWETRGRDPAELYRGARLGAAIDWSVAHGDELGDLDREFLAASRAESEREIRSQRRQNRRLRTLLVGAGVLLALALVAGALALVARSNADQSATAAVAERLGAQALVAKDLDLSLLLARQGVQLDDSNATQGNLEAALFRSPEALRVIRPLPGRLLGVAVSPNGRYLAVDNNDGSIAILDRRTLRTLHVVHNLQLPFVNDEAFTRDGRLIGFLVPSPEFDIVDPATGKIQAKIPQPKGSPHWAISPALDFLLTWSSRSGRSVLTESTYPKIRPVHRSTLGPGPPVVDLESADGRLLVFRASDPTLPLEPITVEVWSLSPWRRLQVVHNATLTWALDRSGTHLALGHYDGSITITDLTTGVSRTLHGRHSAFVQGVGFSPDGRTLVSTADDKQVLVWDVASGALLETLTGHAGRVFGPAFSPDGKTVYTDGLDGAVIGWDLSGAQGLAHPFQAGSGDQPPNIPIAFERFAISPDSRRIASTEASGRTAIVDLASGRKLFETRPTLSAAVLDVAWSPDGRTIATAGLAGRVDTWVAATGKLIRAFPGLHGKPASSVAFSPDGKLLAAGDDDFSVHLWHVDTGAPAAAPFKAANYLPHVAFSPDGKELAATEQDAPGPQGGVGMVWRLSDRKLLYKLNIDDGYGLADALAFSPDGKLIATGGGNGKVKFWNARTGAADGRSFIGNPGWVRSVSFDPTGRFLVTAGTDGLVRLWDVRACAEYGAPLPGYEGTESQALFSPDGSHVVTVYTDGRAESWDVRPGSWERDACAVAGRTLTRDEWDAFLRGRAYHPACARS